MITKFFNIFKENKIIQEIVEYCSREKSAIRGSFILPRQVFYKYHQTLSLTKLRNQMSFEIKLFPGAKFLRDALPENKLEP